MSYVTFEQAKLLKEKGFDENCVKVYAEERMIDNKTGGDKFIGVYRLVTKSRFHKRYHLAPEQHQVVEWLRINHGIFISCEQNYKGEFWTQFHKKSNHIIPRWEVIAADYDSPNSPQEAYSAAIDYTLNNLI